MQFRFQMDTDGVARASARLPIGEGGRLIKAQTQKEGTAKQDVRDAWQQLAINLSDTRSNIQNGASELKGEPN